MSKANPYPPDAKLVSDERCHLGEKWINPCSAVEKFGRDVGVHFQLGADPNARFDSDNATGIMFFYGGTAKKKLQLNYCPFCSGRVNREWNGWRERGESKRKKKVTK